MQYRTDNEPSGGGNDETDKGIKENRFGFRSGAGYLPASRYQEKTGVSKHNRGDGYDHIKKNKMNDIVYQIH
jgi:hypothetical protein